MQNNKSPQSSAGSGHLVAEAERHLEEAGRALDRALQEIDAGKFGPARDLTTAVTGLRKALEAVFSERAKLSKFETDDNGAMAHELDLEKAYAEVRSRMDRLRAVFDVQRSDDAPDA